MTKLVNRAKMTTATTGTGTITLGSAVDGFQTFADAGVANADVVRYVIEDGDAWEIGTGTYTASNTTLTRTVAESSIGGGAITLTGEAVVFVGATASEFNEIRTPLALSPNGATDVIPEPTLTGSVYAPVYSVDTRDVREFQLTTFADTAYAAPVFTASVDADSVAVTPALDIDTQYRWRCRDVADTGEVSDYSADAVFTTANIIVNAPTLTVEGSPSDVPETPTLTSGAFSTDPVDQDTHESTNWIVRLAEDDTVIYQSLADTVNLLSIVVPAGLLDVDTSYKFQVQHIGAIYGTSAVTEVVATTVAEFDIIPLLAVAHFSTPFITIYNQEIDTFTKLADPATLPPNTGRGVAFSSDDTYMAVGHNTSPFITIYKRSGDTFTKLADPATLPPDTGFSVAFSSDDTYMAVAHFSTPFITIYKRSGDTFTKLADPATLPPSTGNGVAFSSDDTYMAVGHDFSPFITIYKRSGDTFTKLADPATLPPGTGRGVAFSSDDTYMAVAHSNSPFITIYKRSGDTFTKLADPATLPPDTGRGVAFSSDDTYMTVAHFSTPFITIYKRFGDTFTKLADPATLPPETGFSVAFSSDDTYMAVAHFSTPFITIYKRSGDTFTKLADPATLPNGTGNGVAFSNTGFPQ